MTDSVGQLPSRPEPPSDDRGTLPPLPSASAAGEATTMPPPAAPAASRHDPAPPADPALRAEGTLEERLAAVTAGGGCTALPPDFGDPQSDWTTVRSDNPFTVLYLDARQAHRITPEMTSRHRDLLQRFWQEKLRSMSQGAARVAILKKYGGADQSERLVRSYPDLIERAYEQLATRGAIDSTLRRITTEAETALFGKIDEKLDDFLVDGILQPDETRALLDFGVREGLQRPAVTARVHDRLRTKGFVPEREPAGDTQEVRLLSTAWIHPRKRTEAGVAVLPAPPRRSLLAPLFLFSLIVVMVLLIASAIRSARSGNGVVTVATVSHIDASAVTLTTGDAGTVPEPGPSSPVESNGPVAMTTAATTITSSPTTTPAPESPVKLEIDAQERRRVREEITAIRQLVDTDPQAGLDRAVMLQQSVGNAYVDERIELAQLRSDLEKALLTLQMRAEQERLDVEAQERAQHERDREWDVRLAAVEELMKQPNYSGAKTLADQLLGSPDIPPRVAERATALREEAVAELQKIFSAAKVKSKTGRTPRRQP